MRVVCVWWWNCLTRPLRGVAAHVPRCRCKQCSIPSNAITRWALLLLHVNEMAASQATLLLGMIA
jgi:hypothetical protein